ncbi:MAG: hypothetical protein DMF07_13625 [Verrucomicrobia bacterium]|nr:MAG: hypothetical protein DMF07_13625 [Verrucomicrobiota bacterium]
MEPGYLLASFAAFALFHSTANALDECMATLKDPHGSAIVREYGKVVATLKEANISWQSRDPTVGVFT